jgi:indolepyruvate ferredoxin oxidoreductase
LFGFNIEFDLNSRDWMLRLMAHSIVLRQLLPQWHKQEKEFRDWYIGLVEGFTFFESQQDYELYVKALGEIETVRGYREIRAPQMEEAKRKVKEWLAQIKTQKATANFVPAKKLL